MTSHNEDTGVIHTGIIERALPKKAFEEELFEWSIADFFSVVEDKDKFYVSPAFIVNSVSWFLVLTPKSGINSQFLGLHIITQMERQYCVEYYFSLKKSDGATEELNSGILQANELSSIFYGVIKRAEVLMRKSELAPQDVVTIMCRLKYEITDSPPSTTSDKTETLKLISLDKLSNNFKDLYDNKDTCDVLLKVMDKEFKVHRSVLIARSSVFAATFKHDTLERQTGVITIPDCDPDTFQEFLNYLYSGKLEELSFSSAQKLYYTSDKYDVNELKTFCIEYLKQCLSVENVCEVAVFADKYEETQLYKNVQDFFVKHSFEILLTSQWEHLLKNDYRLGNKLLTEMVKFQRKK